jgi:uncharacterized protein (TIGR03546 family)
MLIIYKFFSGLLRALNDESSPNKFAAGCMVGVMIGMLPAKGLIPVLLTLLSFLITINLSAVALSAMIFKIISFAFDPLANTIGYELLVKTPGLKNFWTTLYNTPIVPYTNFNNTIVLGSFVLGILFAIPAFFVGRWMLIYYRTHYREKFLQLKIIQTIKATSFYKYYESYRSIKDA